MSQPNDMDKLFDSANEHLPDDTFVASGAQLRQRMQRQRRAWRWAIGLAVMALIGLAHQPLLALADSVNRQLGGAGEWLQLAAVSSAGVLPQSLKQPVALLLQLLGVLVAVMCVLASRASR